MVLMAVHVMRRVTFGAGALAVALIALPAPSAQSLGERATAGTFYLRDSAGEMGGGVDDAVEAPGDPLETYRPNVSRAPRAGTLAVRPPYTFFPHAGTLGQDLSIANYVDVGNSPFDVTKPGLDYECTGYSYGGHSGHDSIIDGFREQAIGVPVFAALDGTVVGVHDGEPDQETTSLVGRPTNFVALAHAGGYQTQYLHLKKGSVSVANGRTVTAGTQLGLTGSSGNSSWPHLHFTSTLNGVAYEPSAGKCRPGGSDWTHQPIFRRDTYVTSFTYGTQPFVGNANYPFDDVTRRGTYVADTRTIYFRVRLRTLPAASTYRFLLSRPDGTTAMDNAGLFGNAAFFKHASYWFSRNVTRAMRQEWREPARPAQHRGAASAG